MAPLSKYHIIRFVLDVSYEDHAKSCDAPDWITWCKRVFDMFGRNPPDALIDGLKRKQNAVIDEYCAKFLEMRNEEKKEALRKQSDKYVAWIKRRDDGNLLMQKQGRWLNRLHGLELGNK